MIICKTPLRISLGGGGTDLPSYYREHGGLVLSAAINKYVYISINEPFTNDYILKYSKIENVKSIKKIKHPIIKETLMEFGSNIKRIEITSAADIPAGTGLGSSSSFTVGLINSLFNFQNKLINSSELSEAACFIEIEKLKEPIGKQDQYIAAHGGIKVLKFNTDNTTEVSNLNADKEVLTNLEKRLQLYFTGITRSAGAILKEQDNKSLSNDKSMINNLNYIKNIGKETIKSIESGRISDLGELMKAHWLYKKERSKKMSNQKIDEIYDFAMKNGAIGGKLIGAGAGGFLMFLSDESDQLVKEMSYKGFNKVDFKFDFKGSQNIQKES